MKVLTLTNNVTDLDTLKRGMEIVNEWLPGFEFTIQSTSRKFTSVPNVNDTNAHGFLVNIPEIAQEASKAGQAWDIALLVYDWSQILPKPTNPANSGDIMQIPMQWYATFPEVFAEFFLHELCHHYFQKYGGTDITHNYDPQFTQKPRYVWYLHLISQFKEPVQTNMYKYFKSKEIEGLKPELVQMLDTARGYAGVPFVISSGLRSELENQMVGGVNDSAHLRGLAVDIKCPNSMYRYRMIQAFTKVGFKRIGVGKDFIHVDCDPSLPQEVIWTYYK